MVWSLVAVLVGAGLGDLLSAPAATGGVGVGTGAGLLSAVAVAGLLACAAAYQIAVLGHRSPVALRGAPLPRLRSDHTVRPPQVVVEARGRPRPRAPSAQALAT